MALRILPRKDKETDRSSNMRQLGMALRILPRKYKEIDRLSNVRQLEMSLRILLRKDKETDRSLNVRQLGMALRILSRKDKETDRSSNVRQSGMALRILPRKDKETNRSLNSKGSILNLTIVELLPLLRRGLSAQAQAEAESPEVVVQGVAFSRKAVLNRPLALNALTTSMVVRLKNLYQGWEAHPDIGLVILKGCGRSFCAGGDVINIYGLANQGKLEECKDFFNKAYQFIYLVGTYMKPHVALLDGWTMGGGTGISIPGMFRVATDKTELNAEQLKSCHVGEYLALTGVHLNGAEMLAAGLATHFSVSARLGWLEERLGTLITDDPSVVETALEEYSDVVYPDTKSSLRRMDAIDRCFSKETVEEILYALEMEAGGLNDEWYNKTIGKLREASPLSLKVALRSIREGRFQSLDECLIREYRTSCHALSKKASGDFYEGIRARLIDKDYSPKWDPPSLEQVSREMVNHYFSPLGEDQQDLELPVKQREAYV